MAVISRLANGCLTDNKASHATQLPHKHAKVELKRKAENQLIRYSVAEDHAFRRTFTHEVEKRIHYLIYVFT